MRKPPTWRAEPEAYLGRDPDGRTYWLLEGHVFSYHEGQTVWQCPHAAFERLKKLRGVRAA